MVVTNFDPLEDVPELLVPEVVPAGGEEANPLDAEAPLDSDGFDLPNPGIEGVDEPAGEQTVPAGEQGVPTDDQSAPVEETESGQ
jgi:hypothetical protein